MELAAQDRFVENVFHADISVHEHFHAPGIYFTLTILGWALLDFGYYNAIDGE